MVRQVSARRERRLTCAPYYNSGPGELYMLIIMLANLRPYKVVTWFSQVCAGQPAGQADRHRKRGGSAF